MPLTGTPLGSAANTRTPSGGHDGGLHSGDSKGDLLSPRRNLFLTFLALCLTLCAGLTQRAHASVDRWDPYPSADASHDVPGGGPWGGSVRRLASPDPAAGTSLWAATGGGVFYSADSGQHWEARNEGLGSLDVADVAVCASAPDVVVAATRNGGFYVSRDRGITWVRKFTSSAQYYRADFCAAGVSPVDSNHLLAGTSYDGVSDRLLESTDGGANWRVAWAGSSVSRIVFAADGVAFVGDLAGALYRVGPLGVALVHSFGKPAIADLSLPGGDGQRILVSQGGGGLWLSRDAGATWVDVGFPLVKKLCLDWCPTCTAAPLNCNTNPYGAAYLEIDAVASHPTDANRIWFRVNDPAQGMQTGLYESADLGANAVAAATPSLAEPSQDVQALLSAGSALWLGEGKAGVFRLDLSARTWAHGSQGLAAYDVADLAFDPATTGGLAVAGGGSSGSAGNGGMYLWDPVLADWVRRHGDLLNTPGTFPSGVTSRIRYRGSDLWVVSVVDALYRSADGGLSWAARNDGLLSKVVSGLAFSPAAAASGVVGTAAGPHYTDDGGATWKAGTGAAGLANALVGVVRDAANGRRFVAAGNEGADGAVYASGDGGKTWTAAGTLPGRQIVSFATSERTAGHWVAGTTDGVYQTLDSGATWVGLPGLPTASRADAVAVAPVDGDPLLAVYLKDLGIYLTRDAGVSWDVVQAGLPRPGGAAPMARGLYFDAASGKLVAAVQNRGLWSLDPVGSVTIEDGAPTAASQAVMLRVAIGTTVVATVRFRNEEGPWSDGQPFSSSVSWTLSPGDGAKRVTAEFSDAQGRVLGWSSDGIELSLPPVVVITSPVAGSITAPSLVLTFTASKGSVVVRVDGVAVSTVSGAMLGPLGNGPHTVQVSATEAGRTGSREVAFTVDAVAPAVHLTSPAAGPIRTASPQLLYAVSDGTVVVKVDRSTVSKVSGDTLGPFDQRAHLVRVEATDAVGNVGSAEVSFTVDTTAPAVTLTAPRSGITPETRPILEYLVDDVTATVVVKVDNDPPATIASGSPLGPLADGRHTVRVEASDAAGNAGWAEVSFEVDTSAPSVVITSPSEGLVRTASPILTYTALDRTGTAVADVVVTVDGLQVAKVSGDTLDGLSDGPHTVRVEATGKAGNVGSDQVAFTVDTVCQPPGAPVVPPQDVSGTGTIGVSWSASATQGATYELQEATDEAFTADVRGVYAGAGLNVTLTARPPVLTYYYRLRAVAEGYNPSAWVAGTNGCRVLRGVAAAPGAPKVPKTSTKEGFTVSWRASKTKKVAYELVEATDPGFSEGPRVIYSGPKTTAKVYGGSDGATYFYRVRATHPEYASSEPVAGANGSALTLLTGRPSSLSVPRKSSTGAYTVKWGASSTKLVTYELEESSDPAFAQGVETVYSGPDRSVALSGRRGGTYYYRVRASKDRYRSSAWRAAAKPCVVTLPLGRVGAPRGP